MYVFALIIFAFGSLNENQQDVLINTDIGMIIVKPKIQEIWIVSDDPDAGWQLRETAKHLRKHNKIMMFYKYRVVTSQHTNQYKYKRLPKKPFVSHEKLSYISIASR